MNKTKIYLDSAGIKTIKFYKNNKVIKGFTTNPSLIAKSKIKNYKLFAKQAIKFIRNKSKSFEVLSDNLNLMHTEAIKISSWGKNVYVKIPIVNSKGSSTQSLIKKLCKENIKINITAVFTFEQIRIIKKSIEKDSDIIVSIFCGRIADTGRDPKKSIIYAKNIFKKYKNVKILWASTREFYNIIEANNCGTDIITVSDDIYKKKIFYNKDLNKFSKETVKTFYIDGLNSKLKI